MLTILDHIKYLTKIACDEKSTIRINQRLKIIELAVRTAINQEMKIQGLVDIIPTEYRVVCSKCGKSSYEIIFTPHGDMCPKCEVIRYKDKSYSYQVYLHSNKFKEDKKVIIVSGYSQADTIAEFGKYAMSNKCFHFVNEKSRYCFYNDNNTLYYYIVLKEGKHAQISNKNKH